MSTSTIPRDVRDAPYREVEFPPIRMEKIVRPDGTILLRNENRLDAFDPNFVRSFFRQAERQGGKALYAQRQVLPGGARGDWVRQTFAETRDRVRAVGQWLIDHGLGAGDPVLLVSGNSIAHATLRLGAMAAGLPVCPVSPNYALLGGSFERLKHVVDLIRPAVIFAEGGAPFAAALRAIEGSACLVVSRQPGELGVPAMAWEEVCATSPGPAIDARIEAADPDGHALYMLTSGSTGMPKAVIQTQRMWSTNLNQGYQALGKAAGWHDVMLDWLPWSHVSGSFNMMAAALFGGSLYIDEGKPLPGLFDETIRNLRELAVPYFSNMPAGYAFLVDALEADEDLCRTFFSKLRLLLYGGAGLPQPLYDRLQALAVRSTGRRIAFTTGYGATETTSGCMVISFLTEKVGIGLPTPGLEVKLVPNGDRYEIRLRGDNITPGYLREPERTAEAFDEEGFYRTSDAARFHDEKNVGQGLYFAGRLAEEFKLLTGTWVYAGQVRTRVVEALAPSISDLLLCGPNREYLAGLGVPSLAGLRSIAGLPAAGLDELRQDAAVTRFLRQSLERYNAQNTGSSRRIERFALIRDLPNAGLHEVSDKGTLNQSIAADNRRGEIERLYAANPAADVIVPGDHEEDFK